MKKFLFTISLSFFSIIAFCQWTGATSVTSGQTVNYTLADDVVFPNYSFVVTGGKVNSTSRTGTNYKVNITWIGGVAGGIDFYMQPGNLEYHLNVTITGCAYTSPSTPATPTVSSNTCGNKTISFSGTPPTGYSWFWQTSATGTETTSSSSSYTVSSSGNYYLRSKALCGANWSSSATVTVTINPEPSIPTAADVTICPYGTGVLSPVPGANGNSISWYGASTGGTPVYNGATLTLTNEDGTPGTTTYYVATLNTANGCQSALRKSISLIVKSATIPSLPVTVTNGSSCGPGTVNLSATPGANGDNIHWYSNGSQVATGLSYAPTVSAATTFYAYSYNSVTGCESFGGSAVTATVNPVPTASVSAANISVCSGSTATITLSNPNNLSGTTLAWTASTTNATVPSLSGTGNITGSFFNDGISQGTATYTITPYTSLCTGTPVTATVAISISAKMPNLDPLLVYGDGPVTFHVPVSPGEQANWFNYYTAPAPVSTQPSLTITYNRADTLNSLMYVSLKNVASGCETQRVLFPVNYIKAVKPSSVTKEEVRVPGVFHSPDIDNLSDALKTKTISFMDGMGRTSQVIAMNASPTGKALVQPVEYDSYGRSHKTYLPYTKGLTSTVDVTTNLSIPEFQGSYAQDQHAFYTATGDKISNDESAFAQAVYEASPLGRILEQGNPGADRQPGTGHTTRLTYSFNSGANSNAVEEVRRFNSDGSSSGFYTANLLSRIQSTDADGHVQVIFQDGRGNTIAKKQQLDQVIDGVMVNWLETYFIYDDFGHIRFVISPKGVAVLKGNGWNLSSVLDSYVHQFVYDGKGRLVEKKTPGQDWNYVVYDPLNRVVLTQDAQTRASNKWAFLKYDQMGRTVMQGIYTSRQTTRSALQQLVDGLYTSVNNDYPANAPYERRGTTLHGYTNVSFPKINADASPLEVWNVMYYDNYDFDNDGNADYNYTVQSLPGENTPTSVTRRLMTGSKKVILGSSTWLYNYVFYDTKYRVIQVRSNNHANAAVDNLTTNVYDFEGKLLMSKSYHNAGAGKESTTLQRQSYDAGGRLENIYRPVAQAEDVVWTNGVGVTVTGNSVVRSNGYGSWGDAGAFSANSIPANGDGWIEFRSGEAYTDKILGLSYQDTNASWEQIDYSIYLTGGGTLYIIEYGDFKVSNFSSYTPNDVFSIERKGGVVYYKKNNIVLYISQTTSTGALYADGTIYTNGATINDVKLYKETETIIAQYEYNELGQLVDKKLHNTTGNEFLQSVDYRYTLQGQLASINNAQLTTDETNDDSNDYFGMEYLYTTTESGLNNAALYNGNISAVKWKGVGSSSGAMDQKSYTYTYDKSNKLLTATSQMYAGAWNKEANALNESMSYDHNGNIKTLQRNQRSHQLSGLIASYASETTDNLTYTYNSTSGDQLEKVTDAATPLIDAGFKDGNTSTNNDYTYDVNGNVQSDLNKGISSITYNLLGKPAQINFTDGKKIEYTYDATGNKLTMKTWQGTALLVTTDYVNGFQYENGSLSSYASPEGRVVMKGTNPEYQYAIADHQGNTRLVFSSAPVAADTKSAGLEEGSNTDFQNYPSGGSRNSMSIYNHTPGGTYSQLLNGGNNSQVGLAKSYKVYPGDKVKIEAYAKYANPTNNSSNVTTFASALLNAFLLPAPAGGELGTASSALNSWGSVVAAGGDGQSNAAPHVSVNIIMFDKNYNFLDAAYDQIEAGAEQVGVSPVVAHDYMTKEYTVKEEGYVFMYIANENPTQVDAYFDDVEMTYTPTSVVQYNEYYPFGLQTSTSWTRENNSGYNFLYNQGTELNSTTGWYETMFRGYDATLGRFLQVDPLAHIDHSTSPFAYAGNNPIMFNDPWGLLVSVDGYSDAQIRSMYRRDRDLGGYNGSFGDWAVDNLETAGGGNRTIQGPDGIDYAFHKGQFGRWEDDNRQFDLSVAGVGGYRSSFVSLRDPNELGHAVNKAINDYGFVIGTVHGAFDTGFGEGLKALEQIKVITGRASNGAFISESRMAVSLANASRYRAMSGSVKALKYGGAVLAIGVVAYNGIDLVRNGGTNRDIAKYTMQTLIAGVGFLGPIGFGVSIGLTLLEMNGGLDFIYDNFDDNTMHKAEF